MSYETEQILRVVRAVGDDWHDHIREQIDAGRNFFLILPGGKEAIVNFCKSFELQSDCLKDRFTRSDLLRMGQHIDSAAFDEMLAAWDGGEQVLFLEQIDFPINRPPHVKPFLVYSPLWGILSQHDEIRPAKHALEESENWEDRSRLSQPAVYQWERNKWKML
ncbi:MAG: hypothetical protein QOD03_950 [Verrucomicrobiota bacterium]|jgi:hypothetical protein